MSEEIYTEKQLLEIAAKTGVSFDTNDKKTIDKILYFVKDDFEDEYETIKKTIMIKKEVINPFLDRLSAQQVEIIDTYNEGIVVYIPKKDFILCNISEIIKCKNGDEIKIRTECANDNNFLYSKKECMELKKNQVAVNDTKSHMIARERYLVNLWNKIVDEYKD